MDSVLHLLSDNEYAKLVRGGTDSNLEHIFKMSPSTSRTLSSNIRVCNGEQELLEDDNSCNHYGENTQNAEVTNYRKEEPCTFNSLFQEVTESGRYF